MTVFHGIRKDDGITEMGDLAPSEVSWEFLQRIPGGLFRYSADEAKTVDYFSDALIGMFGCESEERFREHIGNSFRGMVHPDDLRRVEAEIGEQLAGGDIVHVTYRLNHAQGEEVWVEDIGHRVVDAAGNAWLYVTLVDITDKMEMHRRLVRANERQQILTALSNDVVFDIDCRTGQTDVFGDFEDRFGRPIEQGDLLKQRLCNRTCVLDIHEHTQDWLLAGASERSLTDREFSTPDADGDPIWYRYQSVVVYDDNDVPVRHVGRLLDTNEMIQRESQFKRKAERDGLTGVYNRTAATDKIEALLRTSNGPDTFILVDVDDFKNVNDTYGHPEGDRVLTELARFLENAMRKEDVVVRLGGDEFAVFAHGLGEGPALTRILGHLERGPFAAERADDEKPDHATPSISVGAVCSRTGTTTFDELYAAADELLYNSKAQGKARYSLTFLGE